MTNLLQDLRYALRGLRNAPGFTTVAAITLGLGIGANTAMVGLFDALLVRPPEGVHEPGRVVRFEAEVPGPPGRPPMLADALSYAQYEALRTRAAGFSGVAAYTMAPMGVGEGEGVRNEPVVLASGSYFPVLGVRAPLGRALEPEDDRPGAANPVAVLSWEYWQRAYGGDPGVLGRPIVVAGQPLTIVGVAPRHFVGAELADPAVWVPLSLAGALGYDERMMSSPFVSWLDVVGRLAPGADRERARATAQAAFLAAEDERANAAPPRMGGRGGTPGGARVEIRVGPGGGPPPGGAPPPPRVVLSTIGGVGAGPDGEAPVQLWYLAVTAAVLLIACANVANLMLARGAFREHELAVRLSLGATRRRLGVQLLTEAAVLALLGGAVGLAVAQLAWRLLPGLITMPPLPPLVDARILGVAALLALGTVLLFGAVPLLGLRRPDIRSLLGRAAPAIARGSRGRNALVVAQLAVSVLLLVGAGLFIRSFRTLQAMDLGFDRDRLITVAADPRTGWTPEQAEAFWQEALERARRLPGVAGTALGATVPYLMEIAMPLTVQGGGVSPEDAEPARIEYASPEFFPTLGISIVEGRGFTAEDRAGSDPVAVVSRSFAREQLGGDPIVGRCLSSLAGGSCIRVVGVAEDARFGDLTDESPAMVYRPREQRPAMGPRGSVLYLRTTGAAPGLAASLRRELAALPGPTPTMEIRSLDELIEPQLAPWRASVVLLSVFGGLGIVLAAVGLYGVVAFLVARRTREIGIRMALGATRRRIVGTVLRESGRIVAVGAVAGVLLALLASRFFESVLYGVAALDPGVYAATLALLGGVAFVAALSPARRATRVDPIEALRAE